MAISLSLVVQHVTTVLRLHSKLWNQALKAHIVVCSGSSGGWHAFCTWLISCNSNHAFWGWLIHILDILECPLHQTEPVHCDWLNGIQLFTEVMYSYSRTCKTCNPFPVTFRQTSALTPLLLMCDADELLMSDSITEKPDLNRPVQKVWG